jgi:hypothetical protein
MSFILQDKICNLPKYINRHAFFSFDDLSVGRDSSPALGRRGPHYYGLSPVPIVHGNEMYFPQREPPPQISHSVFLQTFLCFLDICFFLFSLFGSKILYNREEVVQIQPCWPDFS